MSILRTEAEDVGVGELLIYSYKIGKRGYYRRAVDGVGVPLAFWARRFSSSFLAFARCLCHATFFVLFMLVISPYEIQKLW